VDLCNETFNCLTNVGFEVISVKETVLHVVTDLNCISVERCMYPKFIPLYYKTKFYYPNKFWKYERYRM